MIWRASEVMDGYQYKIELCHSAEGKRSLRLRPLYMDESSGTSGDTVVFVSQIVPNDLLRRRDVISISEQIPLEDGQPFFVDAHGMWLTEAESAQIDEGVDLSEVQWATKPPPKFAPF